MKTLYLHIGTQKTGTTSIQHFCHDNNARLTEEGYFYPDFPFEYIHIGKYRNGSFLETIYIDNEGIRHPEKEEEYFKTGLKIIKELFMQHDNLIISNEGIWGACFVRKRGIPRMLELQEDAKNSGYQIKIIVYLRRQDEYLLSWYNQIVKHSISTKNSITWEDYYKNYRKYVQLNYFKSLKKLEEIFGIENIIVKRFDKRYFKDNSLISDFLDIFNLELNDSYCMYEEDNIFNTRLSENTCEIKRIINGSVKLNINEVRQFERILNQVSPISEEIYPCSFMSDEERQAFMQLYEHSNNKVVKRYLKDGQPLFSEKNNQKEKWQKDNIYMVDDIVRFSCMSTLYIMRSIENMKNVLKHPLKYMFLCFKKKLNVNKKQY